MGRLGRDAAGALEPGGEADAALAAAQGVVVDVVLAVELFQGAQGVGEVVDGDDRGGVDAGLLKVVDPVADQVGEDGVLLDKAVDGAVGVGDEVLVVGVCVHVSLQVGGVLGDVGGQVGKDALGAVDVGLGQAGHGRVGQIAADDPLVHLRVEVVHILGAGDVLDMDTGALFGHVVPLQLLEPVDVGRAHEHGVAVGRLARGGRRRAGARPAAGAEGCGRGSRAGRHQKGTTRDLFHNSSPPCFVWCGLFNSFAGSVGGKTNCVVDGVF